MGQPVQGADHVSDIPTVSTEGYKRENVHLPLVAKAHLLVYIPAGAVQLPVGMSKGLDLPRARQRAYIQGTMSRAQSNFDIQAFLLCLVL